MAAGMLRALGLRPAGAAAAARAAVAAVFDGVRSAGGRRG
jgi:hypothetical protein